MNVDNKNEPIAKGTDKRAHAQHSTGKKNGTANDGQEADDKHELNNIRLLHSAQSMQTHHEQTTAVVHNSQLTENASDQASSVVGCVATKKMFIFTLV